MTEIKPLKELGKDYVLQVLRATRGDLDQASRILGITMATLRRRMKEYGLQVESTRVRPTGGHQRDPPEES
jgi:DNA-binding NtrC family response regulator